MNRKAEKFGFKVSRIFVSIQDANLIKNIQ